MYVLIFGITNMILSDKHYIPHDTGFIGGTLGGIVTVAHMPAVQPVFLLDSKTLQIVAQTYSNQNGHYCFTCLPADKCYTLFARDRFKRASLRPPVWDYVTPVNDMSLSEQYDFLKAYDEHV
ncbi:hypothetical protein [Dichelobacter nodosus]|nr:hypothetical protein [Dichelobacter nodosus]